MQSYSRHKLKEDRFQETAKDAVHWTNEHRGSLIVVAIVVLVVIGVAAGVGLYTSSRDSQASAALGEAMRTYTAAIRPADQPADPTQRSFTSIAERDREAAKEFQDVADKYSHTGTGKRAMYMAAVALQEAGDTTNAEAKFKKVIDDGGDELKALAKMSLASIYINTGRDNDAVNLYKSVIDHPTSTVPKQEAQFALAGYYEQKNPAEAKKIYEELSKDESPAVKQMAEAKLQGLGGK